MTSGSEPGGLFCADATVAILKVKTAMAALNMGRLQMLQIVEVVTNGIFWTLRQVETMAVRA
jgi:hypothetical protein